MTEAEKADAVGKRPDSASLNPVGSQEYQRDRGQEEQSDAHGEQACDQREDQ
jgi:hypothetical protein